MITKLKDFKNINEDGTSQERIENDFSFSNAGNFTKSFTYTFNIINTRHANFRKYRDEVENSKKSDIITDSEIVETIKSGSEQILDSFLNGHIVKFKSFLLTKQFNKLNLILEMNVNENVIDITVITLIRTSKYKNDRGNYQIII